MKKEAVNPFLPLSEYIPDGEPHVFGDRVYLFGSHDKENGETFCMLDYEIWSAPMDDLSNWTSKAEWSTSTIDRMLSDEKYVGEVRMQKTFTADFLTGKREKNTGQLDAYLVENAHEPIIDRKTFELAQKIKSKSSPKSTSYIRVVLRNSNRGKAV